MSTSSVIIPVPLSGFGPSVDVSSLVGEKTVTLTGRFRGAYVLYGSHDGTRFAPLLIFNAGGIEGIKQTFAGAFAWVRLKSLASGASGVSASVSGLEIPGDNSFTTVGVGGVVDLGIDAFQVDLNFMGFGRLKGSVIVEGSTDGLNFGVIGGFEAEPASAGLLGGGEIEFSPLFTQDRVRYVQLRVQGVIDGFVVTVGGAQSEGGGSSSVGTLSETYDAGASSLDQTMALNDQKGGKVIFDASGAGFTDPEALRLNVPGGEGAAFLTSGGMVLGPSAIRIGVPAHPALSSVGGIDEVVLGPDAQSLDSNCISIGSSSIAGVGGGAGQAAIALGLDAQALGFGAIAVGFRSHVLSGLSISIGDQSQIVAGCQHSVVMGTNAADFGTGGDIVIGDTAQLSSGDHSVLIGYQSQIDGVGVVGIGFQVNTGVVGALENISIGELARSGSLIDPSNQNIAIGSHSVSEGSDATSIGHLARALGSSSIAMGPNSTSDGDSTICIGSSATGGDSTSSDNISIGRQAVTTNPGDAWGSRNVAIGSPSFTAITNGSVSIGSGANAQGFDHITHADVGLIAIGLGADVISKGGSIGIGNGVTVFNTSTFPPSTEEPSIGIGDGASVLGAGGAVVVGTSASTQSNRTVTVGLDATTIGDNSIAIGNTATTNGLFDIVVGCSTITTSGGHNIAIGDSVVIQGFSSDGCVAIGATATVGAGGSDAIAIGRGVTVAASRSIAIGANSTASATESTAIGFGAVSGANEVVFDNAFNHVVLFRVVSNALGHPDLFSFGQSALVAPDTTSFTLLISPHTPGNPVAVPVTLSDPSLTPGFSYLIVANS